MTFTPEHIEAVCAELHARDGWPPNGAGLAFQDAQRARVRRVLEAHYRVLGEDNRQLRRAIEGIAERIAELPPDHGKP